MMDSAKLRLLFVPGNAVMLVTKQHERSNRLLCKLHRYAGTRMLVLSMHDDDDRTAAAFGMFTVSVFVNDKLDVIPRIIPGDVVGAFDVRHV